MIALEYVETHNNAADILTKFMPLESREALDMGLLLFKVEPTTGTVLSKKLARNRCGLNFDVPFLDVLRRFFHHAKDFV